MEKVFLLWMIWTQSFKTTFLYFYYRLPQEDTSTVFFKTLSIVKSFIMMNKCIIVIFPFEIENWVFLNLDLNWNLNLTFWIFRSWIRTGNWIWIWTFEFSVVNLNLTLNLNFNFFKIGFELEIGFGLELFELGIWMIRFWFIAWNWLLLQNTIIYLG